MPPYGRPADVVFDHHVAQHLLDEIRRTVASLDESGSAWRRADATATADWSGRLAAAYVADRERWRAQLGDCLADLTRLAGCVEHAIATATADQRRILELQTRWDAEARAEADAAARREAQARREADVATRGDADTGGRP